MSLKSLRMKIYKNTSVGRLVRTKILRRRYEKYLLENLAQYKYDNETLETIKNNLYKIDFCPNASIKDYLNYRFYEKTIEDCSKFVSEWDNYMFSENLNKPDNKIIFDDKYKTYEYFSEYYNRECICIDFKKEQDQVQTQAFIKFVDDKKSVCIKPRFGNSGIGVKIYNIEEYATAENLCEYLMKTYDGEFIVEEVIRQHSSISKLYPSSINTLRIATICFDDGVDVLQPVFRVGRGGAIVDNVGAGGIACAVSEHGCLMGGYDIHGVPFYTHPDSGIKFTNVTLLYFEEAKKLCVNLARMMPSQRYISWDLALNELGKWTLVEANRRGSFVWQDATQVGFRNKMMNILERLNISAW